MRDDEAQAAVAVRRARRRAAKLLLYVALTLIGVPLVLRTIPVIGGDTTVTAWLAAFDTLVVAGAFAALPVERLVLAAMGRRVGRAAEPEEGVLRALTVGTFFIGPTPESVTERFLRLSTALNFLSIALLGGVALGAVAMLGRSVDTALWTFPAAFALGAAAIALFPARGSR